MKLRVMKLGDDGTWVIKFGECRNLRMRKLWGDETQEIKLGCGET